MIKPRPSWPDKERLTEIVIFLSLLITYTYTFPRWADPNQNSRLDMVVAVVEDGTFQIDPYVENTVDYAKVGDHYYSDKAPGAAFLGIPIYAGLKLVLDLPILEAVTGRLANSAAFQATLREGGSGVQAQKVRLAIAQVALSFVAATLPSALLATILFRQMRRFTPHLWPRLGVVWGYSLLTPAFAYAGAFYGHQLSAFLLFAAFSLVWAARAPFSTGKLIGIGLLLGYSVISEYPAALVAAILYVYTWDSLRRQGEPARILWVTLSGGVIAAGWMLYNTTVFGGPLELGYSYSEQWLAQHHTGFMSLTMPRWEAIWGITFGAFRGLFVLSPLLLLAIPGFVLWRRWRQEQIELWVALGSVLAFFAFNAASIMWWGGFSIGPRYLLPALPFLVLPMALVFEQYGQRRGLKALVVALFGWSGIATWGLTLAAQSFPPDTIRNPLLEYAWPNWQQGNLARNLGTLLGLNGPASLLPLFLLLALLGLAWLLITHHVADEKIT